MPKSLFERIAEQTAKAAGHPITFVFCCLLIVVWGAMGPVFRFSDTWQLIINTGTTIVTFLMVILLQNSTNRDGKAIQIKLDELIRATDKARNELIAAETKTEAEIHELANSDPSST